MLVESLEDQVRQAEVKRKKAQVKQEMQSRQDQPRKEGLSVIAWLLIGLLVCLAAVQAFQSIGGSSADCWEYTVVMPPDPGLEDRLNDLGEDGWELVFARRAMTDLDIARYEMILKRRKD